MIQVAAAIISAVGEVTPYDDTPEVGKSVEEINEMRRAYVASINEEMVLGKFNSQVTRGNIGGVKWILPAGRSYNVSFDFATIHIGVYITDVNHTMHVLLDFFLPTRDAKQERREKASDFEMVRKFLGLLLRGSTVNGVWYEDIPSIAGRYKANNALHQARGVLESWFVREPFIDVRPYRFYTILPQTWKAVIIDKRKGTYVTRRGKKIQRFNDKISLAEDIADKHPELKTYFMYRNTEPLDSFDAAGIYHGWRSLSTSESGNQTINSISNYAGNVIVWHKFIPDDKVGDHDFLWSGFEEAKYNNKPKFLEWREGSNPYKCYTQAVGRDSMVVTRITDPIMVCAVSIFCDYPLTGGGIVTFICRRRDLTQSNIKYLCEQLPYEEIHV